MRETMAQFQSSEVVSTILIFLPLIFFTINKLIKSQSLPLPPGPKSWPIFTTIDHLRHPKTNHLSLANLAQTHGPLMHLHLGTRHTIVASSPAAASEILKIHDRQLSGRGVPHVVPKTPAQIDRLSFWADTTSGNWKNLRAVCRVELFSGKALDRYARVRAAKAAEVVAEMREFEGTVADVEKIVFAGVVNTSSNVYFSRDIDRNLMGGILKGIGEAFALPNLSDLYPFLGALDFKSMRRKYRECSMKMWEVWKPIVKERRESEVRHENFLDQLISKGFGDDQIDHLLEDLFSGGIHTTTLTIKNTLMELLKSPPTMNTLKQELDAALDGQDSITNSHVDNLPYLQSCIKETLRLHPPAPLMLAHRAYEACHVMGYTIPKNAEILVNVWAIGRDPTAWEEPLQYRPERFLSAAAVDYKGNDFEYLPFGAGRRICPGMNMAAKIMSLFVAELVYFFDWSVPSGTDVDQINGPLLLIPRARK